MVVLSLQPCSGMNFPLKEYANRVIYGNPLSDSCYFQVLHRLTDLD